MHGEGTTGWNPPSQGSPTLQLRSFLPPERRRQRKTSGSQRMLGFPMELQPLSVCTSSFTSINTPDGAQVFSQNKFTASEIWQHPPEDILPSIHLPTQACALFFIPPFPISISPSCCLLFPPEGLKVNICRSVAALEHFKEHRVCLWTQPLMRLSGKDAEVSKVGHRHFLCRSMQTYVLRGGYLE